MVRRRKAPLALSQMRAWRRWRAREGGDGMQRRAGHLGPAGGGRPPSLLRLLLPLLVLRRALLVALRLGVGGGQAVGQAGHLSVQGVPRLPQLVHLPLQLRRRSRAGDRARPRNAPSHAAGSDIASPARADALAIGLETEACSVQNGRTKRDQACSALTLGLGFMREIEVACWHACSQ